MRAIHFTFLCRIIAVVICLGALTSSSASPQYTLPPIDLNTLPAWYVDDPTDTDGDGLPDFWEIGTHGNPLVYDSELDRDDDGLTDLQEFYYKTNPRRADTDADGFTDSYEMLRGMNPLVKDDTSAPNEPDEDNNGLPDIWQAPNSWYPINNYYKFIDNNGDGWDDNHAGDDLPPATDNNYDVLVTIRTSRSAALSYGGSRNFIIQPTTGTEVKLRLALGVDHNIVLLAEPPNTPLPAGSLWKATLDISMLSRTGQTSSGGALMLGDGRVVFKEVITDKILKRFDGQPPAQQQSAAAQQQPPPQSSLQSTQRTAHTMRAATTSAPDDDGSNPNIAMRDRMFKIGVNGPRAHHGSGVEIGAFHIVENTTGAADFNVHWSADYGTMTPTTSAASWLTTGNPPYPYNIVVTANLEVNDYAIVSDYIIIGRCTPPCGDSCAGCGGACPNFSLTPKALAVQKTDTIGKITVISNGCSGASGGINWTVVPSGLTPTSSSESEFVFNPANTPFGKYTVTATSKVNSSVSDSAEVYVVEIETVTKAMNPPNRQRRTIGVAEEVVIQLFPSSMSMNWTTTAGTLTDANSNSNSFIAPFTPTNVTVTANMGGGSVSIEIEVLAPSGYVIDNIEHWVGYPTNVAGAGMNMYYRVTPIEVSFYQVDIREVAMTSTDATGYYTNSVWPSAWLTHDPLNPEIPNDEGWRDLNEANRTKKGFDEVGSGAHNPLCTEDQHCDPLCVENKPHWAYGRFSWPIPNEWRVRKRADPNLIAHEFIPTDQFFAITPDGTAMISKFGRSFIRPVNSDDYHEVSLNY